MSEGPVLNSNECRKTKTGSTEVPFTREVLIKQLNGNV